MPAVEEGLWERYWEVVSGLFVVCNEKGGGEGCAVGCIAAQMDTACNQCCRECNTRLLRFGIYPDGNDIVDIIRVTQSHIDSIAEQQNLQQRARHATWSRRRR